MLRMTFGETLTKIIYQRGLSATAVAEELGFKNRTAFFRILHDESRDVSIRKCFEAVRDSELLALSDEEIERLREAIRVNELGRKTYGVHRALHEMVYPSIGQAAQTIELEGAQGMKTLDDLMMRMDEYTGIIIVIMGACSKALMDRLHQLTLAGNVSKILHFFAYDEENLEDVKIFASMSNLLFSDVYSIYCLNETRLNRKNWWLRSGAVLFNCDGRFGCQLTALGEERYLYTEDLPEKIKTFWNGILRNTKEQIIRLKGASESQQMGMEQYVDFTRSLEQMERGREIYIIKPDFPMNCVPAEILASLVRDAFKQEFSDDTGHFDKMIARMYDIHDRRVRNLYEKRRATYMVLDVEAMQCFARTGKRRDHLFLCRPYTPEERVRILTLLRDQAQNNPYFHILMSHDERLVADRELTVYEGFGVAIIKADTSWELHRAHQEVMLESKLLASYFKSYIKENVIAKGVMTKEESLAVLDGLIEMARRS